jgi:preprotein translocase subunit SecE
VSVVVFVAGVTLVIWLLNWRAANRIQARIDALENDL